LFRIGIHSVGLFVLKYDLILALLATLAWYRMPRPAKRKKMLIEPFLKNYWYVAAWTDELGDKPLQRWLLDEPLVLFRTESGQAVALADRCPHRGAPLSNGRVTGEAIECGYHGMTFGANGACVRLPGQPSAPPKFGTRAYPVAERWKWVFIWMGDPDKADERLIPDYHWLDDPGWVGSGETAYVKCHNSLLRDNLLDLSHAHFVHQKTLATDAVVEFPIEVETGTDRIIVTRRMTDIAPSPFFARLGNFNGRVNHQQVITFTPGANIVIATTVTSVDDPDDLSDIRVLNALTPATGNSTHYFWSLMRSTRMDEDKLSEFAFTANRDTFVEDFVVVEAQQEMLEKAPAPPRPLHFHVDGGVNAAQALVRDLLAVETRSQG
jgi:vanillate O-demethylase monooxygenase subunit